MTGKATGRESLYGRPKRSLFKNDRTGVSILMTRRKSPFRIREGSLNIDDRKGASIDDGQMSQRGPMQKCKWESILSA